MGSQCARNWPAVNQICISPAKARQGNVKLIPENKKLDGMCKLLALANTSPAGFLIFLHDKVTGLASNMTA